MISIIIPVYREQKTIQQSIKQVQALAGQQLLSEILVVQTPEEHYECATIICPTKNRAAQMNHGAQHAKGDILLFLHADTVLPDNALSLITQFRKGAFSLGFNHPALIYQFLACLTTLRSRLTRVPYGDQAIFLTKAEFDLIGGYQEIPILEDVKLAQKIRPCILKAKVYSSVRRYQNKGIVKTVLSHRLIMLGNLLGISPYILTNWR